jgi:UDP-N-acetylmuramyl pentapeptide phosphotransferase/UDP-N-acetylglucosamine-1-phosphate transferase
LIFLFGTLSDYQKLNSPKIRIFGQVLFVLIFVKISNVNLYDTRIDFLDNLLSFEYFNILFVTFCVLILINGSNFIDGLNGLVSGYYIIVLLILYYLNLETAYASNQFIIFFVSVLVVIFILNLFNKIYVGDSGSYLLGFFVGIYMINIYVDNNNISPFFIILLLWYPCFENLFSIIRKIQLKSSPLNPDNKHIHQLVFVYFKNKLKLKKIIINNISSMLIIFYNLIIISVGAMNIYNTKFQILLILTNVFTYLILYKILHFTKKFKNSKS